VAWHYVLTYIDMPPTSQSIKALRAGWRDFDITEIDITDSDITEFDITDTDIPESDITEIDITRKGKLI